MRRYGWLLGALAALLLAAPVALAEEAGEQPAKKKRAKKKRGPREKARLRGEYGMMVSVLKLDEETKAKFEAAVKAGQQALQDWQKGDGAKWKELNTAMREARKNKDKEKMTALGAQLKELNAARAKIMGDNTAKLMELLNDEQKAVWAGFVLRRSLMGRLRRLKLTEDQVAQLQKLCEEKAKTIPAAADRKNAKARREGLNKLYAEVGEKILNEEQRTKLAELMKKRGGRGRKPGQGEGRKKPKREGGGKKKDAAPELGNPAW